MLGVAVVGAGRWGRNLVRSFDRTKNAKLLTVCDASERARAEMSALYPEAAVTADFDAVLADDSVDAVAIAVDAPLHYAFAKAALDAGKHTYVEKPLTLASADASDLVETAAARGRKLMVGHLLKYHPCVDYLKQLIRGGDLGDVLYLYSQRVNLGIVRKEENSWWSLAPHDVAVACHLFDSEPVSVSASGQAYLQSGVEDVVFANMKFADGRMAQIHVSWLDPHKIRKLTLVGSQKMAVFDDMEPQEKIRVYDKGAEVPAEYASFGDYIGLRFGDVWIPRVDSSEPLRLECEHFLECVRSGEAPRSDGRNGLDVVKVLEAATRSLAADGAPVRINA